MGHEAGAGGVGSRNGPERAGGGICIDNSARQGRSADQGRAVRGLQARRFQLRLLAFAAAAALARPASAQAAAPEVELWRLDCGALNGEDFSGYSDTHRYAGQKRDLVVSCYLIRHGDEYLLWDTGLDAKLLVDPEPLAVQLGRIGLKPAQIRCFGISHRHSGHTGQAVGFPGATLLIGAEDLEALRQSADAGGRAGLLPWLEGGSKAEPVKGDKDVFGDGSVVMLATPRS